MSKITAGHVIEGTMGKKGQTGKLKLGGKNENYGWVRPLRGTFGQQGQKGTQGIILEKG